EDGYGGAAQFVDLMHQLQERALTGVLPERVFGTDRGVVTLSSGDNFLAGPAFNASLQLIEDNNPQRLYDSILLSLAGDAAATIGTHAFDFGPEVTARFIQDAGDLVFLSANADFSAVASLQALVDAGRIAPSTVIEENGRKI